MKDKAASGFSAEIQIIGVNPFVLLPNAVLAALFLQSGKSKGPIQVCGTINNVYFLQTLMKYKGLWRLYLNTPVRKATGTKVGDTILVEVGYDPSVRVIPMHTKLVKALDGHGNAKAVFDALSPSKQKEIVRYIHMLKTEASVDKNVACAIEFLEGKRRFVGREKP